MIKTALKHLIYEACIEVLFEKIEDVFSIPDPRLVEIDSMIQKCNEMIQKCNEILYVSSKIQKGQRENN